MLNKLMMGVALSVFALSGAMAQSNPSTSTTPNKPAMSNPADTSKSMDKSSGSSSMEKSSTTGASTDTNKSASDTSKTPSTSTASSSSGMSTSGAKFVTTQSPDQWLASKFKGTDVVGSDDKKIGDVSDILFDKNGKVEAFVISVGGFLGVGSKDVALAPSAFTVEKGKQGESDKLKLAMNKDELKQAQNFEPYKAPQSTTGSATRPTGAGPGGMKPPAPHK